MRRIGLGFGIGFNFRPRYGATSGTPAPTNALILNGQVLTLNGQTLTLGA